MDKDTVAIIYNMILFSLKNIETLQFIKQEDITSREISQTEKP